MIFSAAAVFALFAVVRAVLDTNVLVAALRTRRGASFQLLRHIRARRLIPVVSVPLFFEYEAVLSRPGILSGALPGAVESFLNAFLFLAEPRAIYYLWRPLLADAQDEMLVELAMTAGGVPLITLNVRDMAPAVRRLGLRVLTPADALGMLSNKPRPAS